MLVKENKSWDKKIIEDKDKPLQHIQNVPNEPRKITQRKPLR